MTKPFRTCVSVNVYRHHALVAAWYKAAYLRPPVFDNGIKVEGVRDHKRLKAKLDRIIADLGAKQLTAVTEHELRAYASLRRSRDSRGDLQADGG